MSQNIHNDQGRVGRNDAPEHTVDRPNPQGYRVVGRTVTINASPEQLDVYFEDPARLNAILGEKMRVEKLSDDRLLWMLEAGAQRISLETALVHERKQKIRTWRSVEGADFDVEIKIHYQTARSGRGCEVAALITYRPDWGALGDLAAWLRGVNPKLEGRQALKRLKMLVETGEIATAQNRRLH